MSILFNPVTHKDNTNPHPYEVEGISVMQGKFVLTQRTGMLNTAFIGLRVAN